MAAQSPGSPAARPSVCAAVGTMKSRFTVISGSVMARHGEMAIILSRTASLKIAAATRWASRTLLALRPLPRITAIRFLMSSRRTRLRGRFPNAG